jgi:hypothetical protein
VSAIFQRPLCEMGAAYDHALRPILGEPDVGSGGPCDDRPHPVELAAASADVHAGSVLWRSFSLCPEHEEQLRRHDRRVTTGSRFRTATAPSTPARSR